VAALVADQGWQAVTEVTWREGSRGPMRSHFLSLRVRPAGVESRRLARAAAADENGWDGVLPDVTLPAEWPAGGDQLADYQHRGRPRQNRARGRCEHGNQSLPYAAWVSWVGHLGRPLPQARDLGEYDRGMLAEPSKGRRDQR
jgi:hypothetical protein